MKRLVLALAATLAFAGTASAADLPPPPPVAPEAPPAFSWEHTIYVGVQVGYGIGYKEWDYTGGNTHTVRGILAGIQGGINVQRGNLVVGGEADVNWSNVTGSALCPPNPGGYRCTSQINWLGTWTARAGWMAGPVLLYVEGGLAVANETFIDDELGSPAIASSTIWNLGWTVGGGAEVKIGSSWSVDLEYAYMNFGANLVTGLDGPLLVYQSMHTVRLGLNRLF